MKKSVIIGLSGGVDSSVAAYLLQQQGFSVTGLTLKVLDDDLAIQNAKKIADFLNIRHITLDIRADFNKIVVQDFIDKYNTGQTPSPCILCNKTIKWHFLYNYAKENNIDFIASGHYVKIVKNEGVFYIGKGADEIKDQSYFLWDLPQKYLKKMITPLGNFTKEEIKIMAQKNGLNKLINKKESMGVCFLKGRNYRDFLQEKGVEINKKGDVLNETGEIIGEHYGIVNYTTGQKNGMNIFTQGSFYVKKLDHNTNTLTVTDKKSLNVRKIILKDYYFANIKDIEKYNGKINVKIRGYGLNPQETCKLKLLDNNKILVELNDDAWAPAIAQPVVFYYKNIVLGGGITYDF